MNFIFLVTYFQVSDIVFIDESGMNREFRRERARAKRGVKIHAQKSGKRVKRTNVVAGLYGKKHIAVQCYEHSTTADFFEDWFEWALLAEIPEGGLVILDNASFHRKERLIDIASRYGVFVLFLPPYSPDFNPIEKSWANLKRWLCDNLNRFRSLDMAIEAYFGCFYY